jgi:signal transduction histidine kinase
LGLNDGLLTPECAWGRYPCAARTANGRIWVPTRNGLASVLPGEVRLNVEPLPVHIEAVVANRTPVADLAAPASSDPGGSAASLRLAPGSGRVLAIHYTAPCLVNAERIRFRHYLEGYDEDWSSETSLRLAIYTNLDPGRYRFHVQACNPHGIWNGPETTLVLAIAPWIHQTWWFRIACALAAAAALATVYGLRLRGVRRLAALEHAQRLAAERSRIARDMHDELGATLTRLSFVSDPRFAAESGAESDFRRRVSETSRDLLRALDEVVWAVNPAKDRLETLASYLVAWAQDFLRPTGLSADFDIPEELPEISIPSEWRHHAFLVFKEALRNAVRHANATRVAVRLALADACLCLSVADNGCGMPGFAPGSAPGRTAASEAGSATDTVPGAFLPRSAAGNGLRNMQTRAGELGAELRFRPTPGGGTTVELRVPLPPPPRPARSCGWLAGRFPPRSRP